MCVFYHRVFRVHVLHSFSIFLTLHTILLDSMMFATSDTVDDFVFHATLTIKA